MAVKKNTQSWRNADYRTKVLSILQEEKDIIFFDTETTGLSPEKNQIIEIAAIKYHLNEDNTLVRGDTLHQYIQPPYLLPPEIVDLTGITDADLADCPFEEDVATEIEAFFGKPTIVCGHCVDFDVRFLNATFARNKLSLIDPFEMDTRLMAKDIIPKDKIKDYKLGTLAHYYGIDEGVAFHSAIEDIQTTARLFQILLFEYIELAQQKATRKYRPTVRTISFWEGFRGFSRIYVNTSAGTVYFDVRNKSWHPKDLNMDTIDVDYVEKVCWDATGCQNVDQFAKFNGSVRI